MDRVVKLMGGRGLGNGGMMEPATRYICPHCKTEQTSIGVAIKELSLYECDISKGMADSWEHQDVLDSEHAYYYCPECGEKISDEFVKGLDIEGL